MNWLKKHPTTHNRNRKTFYKELELLNTILNWYKNFINESFRVPITKKHRMLCVFKPTTPRRPDYFIPPGEAQQWIEWLKHRYTANPVYWKLASFMLLTGARVSEVCGLKWDCVDLQRGIIRIVRRVRWDHKTKRPFLEEVTKTSQSARVLHFGSFLRTMLTQMKSEAGEGGEGLVFSDKKNQLLKYNAIQFAFNRGFKALHLPWRSTHILRHSYATIALMATQNLSLVQSSLGHTTQRMTQRYAKTTALLSSEVGDRVSEAVFHHSPPRNNNQRP